MITWQQFLEDKDDSDLRFRARGLITQLVTRFPDHLRAMVEDYSKSGKADGQNDLSGVLEQLLRTLDYKPEKKQSNGPNKPDLDNVVTPSAADKVGLG